MEIRFEDSFWDEESRNVGGEDKDSQLADAVQNFIRAYKVASRRYNPDSKPLTPESRPAVTVRQQTPAESFDEYELASTERLQMVRMYMELAREVVRTTNGEMNQLSVLGRVLDTLGNHFERIPGKIVQSDVEE